MDIIQTAKFNSSELLELSDYEASNVFGGNDISPNTQAAIDGMQQLANDGFALQ